ncbi:hypothetical protein BBJ28_00026396 [Nothophytophthora sp. Chile5]|nr:hypothetical protein BBJ28_00026396 [Nothophytophthora sp. Chile5]
MACPDSEAQATDPTPASPPDCDTFVADLVDTIATATGDEQQRALLLLVRKCINRQEREQMYEANGIHVLSGVVNSGDAYLTQLYALKCLGCATNDSPKLSEPTLEKLRESVREATPEELASLVDVLQHGSEQEKDDGAMLCASVATRGQPDALRDVGVVPPLIEMLKGGGALQTLWAANALGTLAYRNNENRVAIAGAEGVEPMVALLRTGTEEQIHQAARALGYIADNKATCVEIAHDGGISPLVALVRTGTDEQKQWAAIALGNIAVNNDAISVEIAREGGISPLVALVRAGTDRQKQWAVYALGKLAVSNEANRTEIARDGGISPLVSLMRAGTDTQKQWATFALRQLAANKEVNHVMTKVYGDVERLLDGSKKSSNLRRIFSSWRR